MYFVSVYIICYVEIFFDIFSHRIAQESEKYYNIVVVLLKSGQYILNSYEYFNQTQLLTVLPETLSFVSHYIVLIFIIY